ncbi:MAG: hypothetical protein HQ567_13890 [Candidatus Nealsonbacteria bacterium]|nr:hypothetical protein [Candidatus Nealsonbacteria bacterium]
MTATLTRTDPHRPSAIDPTEYEFVGIEYMRTDDIGECFELSEHRRIIGLHRARTGAPYSQHRHGGNCMICGAHALYTVLFYHHPSNVYIRTGFDCAENMDLGEPAVFRSIKAAVKSAREAKAGKQKAALTLADAGLSRAWELFQEDDLETLIAAGAMDRVTITTDTCFDCWLDRACKACNGTGKLAEKRDVTREHTTEAYDTLCSIVRKLCKYGYISEKAESFLRTIVGRIDRRREIEAERAAEKEAADPCPTGRVVIEGEVIKAEWKESAYGGSLKMTVKTPGGWLCWGTAPGAFDSIEEPREHDGETWTIQRGLHRGDRVKFTATLTPSDRDPKFGFFKRPAKAEIVEKIATTD